MVCMIGEKAPRMRPISRTFFRGIMLYHRHLSIIVGAKYLKIMAKALKLWLPGLKDDILQTGTESNIMKDYQYLSLFA